MPLKEYEFKIEIEQPSFGSVPIYTVYKRLKLFYFIKSEWRYVTLSGSKETSLKRIANIKYNEGMKQ